MCNVSSTELSAAIQPHPATEVFPTCVPLGTCNSGWRARQLIQSQQCRARRHLFLAERAAFRIPRTISPPPRVQSVGVIGAGTMGAGIAIAFLFAGFPVTLVDAKKVSPSELTWIDYGMCSMDRFHAGTICSVTVELQLNLYMIVLCSHHLPAKEC